MAIINGTAGNDLLNTGTAAADSISGLAGDDTLYGYAGNDTLLGGDGNDGLYGGDGNDSLDGGVGDDHFVVDAGDDTIIGGAGFDYVSYGIGADAPVSIVFSAPGAGTATVATGANAGTDQFSGIEAISGSDFNDTFVGSSGDEIFTGMAGNDSIDGGAGVDKVYYDYAGSAVTVNLATGIALDGDGGTDTLSGIEKIDGSAYADSITGSVADETIAGAAGNDTLIGGGGNDWLDGGAGNDSLDGGLGDDRIAVGGGNNTVIGGDGKDTVDFDFQDGSGVGGVVASLLTNTATVAGGNGGVTTMSGIEAMSGTEFADSLTGDGFDNQLEGWGNDTLIGNAGNDMLDGGAGNDSIDGGTGDDLIAMGGGSNTIVGGTGFDIADFFFQDGSGIGGVTATITAGTGSATVSGANGGITTMTGIEGLSGTEFNDTLTGDVNNNYIAGWGGNDSLVGGAGADTMYGGQGNDTIDGGIITDKVNGTDFNLLSYWDDYDTPNNLLPVNVNLQTGIATGQGTDTFSNINMVRGSEGNDTITGSSTAMVLEQIEGGLGNDTLDGGTITDTLNGENSNRVSYQNASGSVVVDLAAGTATGAEGNDALSNFNQIRGSSFDDTLLGSNRTDVNEFFEGMAGNDSIDGRGGNDFVRFDKSTGSVTASLVTGIATGNASVGTDTLVGIEGLGGSNYADTLIGGNAASNGFEFFQGMAGNDFIDGGTGYDRADYNRATAGVNVILGGLSNGSATGDASVGTDTLVGIEGVRGSAFNDTLTGSNDTGVYETFEGREGNDSITGGAGTDRADYFASKAGVTVNLSLATATAIGDVSVGTDTLVGIEDIRGSSFNDSITGSSVANKLEGNGGNDTLIGNDGNDTLDGGAGDDRLDGGNGNDQLLGGAGNDTLLGGAGVDYLDGGAGNDSIDGGVILDRINYSDSNTVSYSSATGAVNVDLSGITGTGTTGTGTATGDASVGTDTLQNIFYVRGSAFGDTLTGSAATTLEVFEGGLGDDTIDGGLITDTMNGDNVNRISYQNASGAVQVNLATGAATGADGNDTLLNISQVRGSSYGDSLTGSNRADGLPEHFEGRAGDDTIDGAGGQDVVRYDNASGAVQVNLATGAATGADGNDILISIEGIRGSRFADSLTGGNAASDSFEFFMGLDGADTIDGGTGYDRADYTLSTAGVNVNLLTGLASDGYGTTDTLISIEGVRGSAYNDTLTGSNNTGTYEVFEGREGADSINGGLGTDRADYYASRAGVTVNLTTGIAADGYGTNDTLAGIEDVRGSRDFNDSITGSSVANKLEGSGGNDTLIGNDGNDTLDGGAGDDRLDGGNGNDQLLGGAGNDTLLGGAGVDYLDGGAGNDSIDGGVILDRINYSDSNTVSYSSATGAVNVDLSGITGTGTTGTGTATGDASVGTDTLQNIFYVRGSAFGDTLTGSAATTLEVFEGGLGDDTIDGGLITDTMNGDNVNRISYQNASGAVQVNLATGAATGADGNDTLLNISQVRGSSYGDSLTGSNRADGLPEHFEGRAGDDTIDGAGGQDVVRYDNASGAVQVNLATGAATGADGNDILISIEGIRGSRFADSLTGGNAASDSFEFFMGLDGADTIDGGTGYDRADYTLSTAGVNVNLLTGLASDGYGTTDTLISIEGVRGSAYNDTLTGSNNTGTYEVFEGREGADSINGGLGTDRADYYASRAGVTVNLTTGIAADGYGTNDTLAGIEDVRGSRDFNDSITGSSVANKLEGQGGNDTLNGGLGNDTLEGGTGNDVYIVDSLSDVVTEVVAEGTDRVETALAGYTLASEVENLTYTGVAAFTGVGNILANSLVGAAGNDSLNGDAGNDTLIGNGGNDTLNGGAGVDSLVGGLGNDVYVVDDAGDTTVEVAAGGTDQVNTDRVLWTLASEVENLTYTGVSDFDGTGNASANSLVGAAGNDTLRGLVGNDTLVGGAGDDTLDGGAGSDSLVGGAGNDSYVIDVLTDVISEDSIAGSGTDQVNVLLTAAGTYTLAANLENATIGNATAGVSLTGNALNNTLIGNALANVLAGDIGNDSLVGGAGNDTLNGGTGNDTLEGNAGDDVYIVDSLSDVVTEVVAEGTDRVETALAGYTLASEVENLTYTGVAAFTGVGNILANSLVGAAGNDSLNGDAGNDTLIGNGGNDTLNGGAGVDSLVGGLGNDVYVVDDAGDTTVEVAAGGTDQVNTDRVLWTLASEVENLTYTGVSDFDGTGNASANSLVGAAGNDTLRGLVGNDILVGGAGDDTLDGGVGTDSLVGGTGNDIYVVDATTDVIVEGLGEGIDGVGVALTAAGTFVLANNVENGEIINATLGVNLTGNALGNDLTGNAQTNVLLGLDGNDSLDGDAGNDSLDGGIGSDLIYGGLGNDTLLGGAGDDTLDAGTGVDVVDGGAGSDTLNVIGNFAEYAMTHVTETDTRLVRAGSSEDITLRGIENVQFLDGLKTIGQVWNNNVGALGDYLTGDAGNNSISGLAGSDTIYGLGGNDTLIGGAGSDVLYGGAGDDIYEVDVATDVVTEQNAEGTDLVKINFAAAGTYAMSAEVEYATVTAGAGIAVNVTGNQLNNIITGNGAANTILAGLGNDTLIGGVGSDSLVGGGGDDVYELDVASDVVVESVGEGTDLVKLGFTSTASYTLTTNVENAIVTSAGSSFAVNVTGNASNNTITGHAGANSLSGLDGNDTLIGSGGNDTIDGGIGSDTAVLDGVLIEYAISRPSTTQTTFTHIASGATVSVSNVEYITFAGDSSNPTLASLIAQIGSPGADTLTGGGADDTLAGGLGNDSLVGGLGNDDLQGGDGLDTLNGGAGNDILDGGAGNDTYQFAIGGGDDIIDQNDTVVGGIDTVELASPIGDLTTFETGLTRGWHSYDDLVITVNSEDGNGDEVVDHIVVNDFFTNDLVNAGGAIDQIRFASNSTTLTQAQILSELLKGTAGDDWLRGYANTNDSISGGSGNDTIGGAAGNDTLIGGSGSDQISGDAGADSLDGGSGSDTLVGGDGNDTLSGAGNNDNLSGGLGSDTYLFGAGYGQDVIADLGVASDVDILKFTAGTRAVDVTVARTGDDLKVSLTGGEQVLIDDYFLASGTGQIEQFVFADGSTWSSTAVKAKVLVATGGNDYLSGYLGNESLQGLGGNDTILGNEGNDTLSGGDGYDVLTGGIGADRFVFNTADALVNADLITDFVSGTDKIGLSASVFTGLGSVGSPIGLSDHLIYDSGTGALSYDADGAGGNAAVQFATLGTGTHPATLGMDFIMVS